MQRPSRLFLFVPAIGFLVNVAGLPGEWSSLLSRLSLATLVVIAGWTLIVALDTA